jgi:hypothetical protein
MCMCARGRRLSFAFGSIGLLYDLFLFIAPYIYIYISFFSFSLRTSAGEHRHSPPATSPAVLLLESACLVVRLAKNVYTARLDMPVTPAAAGLSRFSGRIE